MGSLCLICTHKWHLVSLQWYQSYTTGKRGWCPYTTCIYITSKEDNFINQDTFYILSTTKSTWYSFNKTYFWPFRATNDHVWPNGHKISFCLMTRIQCAAFRPHNPHRRWNRVVVPMGLLTKRFTFFMIQILFQLWTHNDLQPSCNL